MLNQSAKVVYCNVFQDQETGESKGSAKLEWCAQQGVSMGRADFSGT